MNNRMIVYMIGRMLGVEGLLLLVPALVSFLYGEQSGIAFLLTAAILLIIFLLAGRKNRKIRVFMEKKGLHWSGLPGFCGHCSVHCRFLSPVRFQIIWMPFLRTVSGFTTTGSTILTDIEALPQGMLFWRALTHWIGGMGVLVFVMVLLNLDDDGSMYLMRAEVPGPEADKLVPKARSTARILYLMYLILTMAEVIFLLFGGMNLYDALIHSFSTAGTGGFSNRNASVSYYDSAYIDGVITVFMILFGINFNIYFAIYIKNWKSALKNEEARTYLGVIAAAILMITVNIYHIYGNVASAFRYSSFQVAAVITTTGFYTADFNLWPEFSKTILLVTMIIGACAGSTGGGMKVSRILILCKSVKQEIKRILHPKAVTVVTVNGQKVGRETLHGVYVYSICYALILVSSVLIVSID